MASLIQATAALNLASTDPTSAAYPGNTVAGNYLYAFMSVVGTTTVTGVTDTQGNTWTQKGQYTTASSNIEIWRAVAGSSAANTLSIDMAALPTGGSTVVLCEVEHSGTPSDGPNNTLAFGAGADPLVLATLTTTNGGIIFTIGRVTTNFGLVSWGDGFNSLHSGSTLGRGLFGYRITSDGVSAAPTADMTSTESADSITIAFYDGAGPKVGTHIFGTKGSVSSTRTVLANLDDTTRTVSAVGSVVVGGSLMLIEQASAPTAIANAVRLFTEDNGAGKTRLMAQFGTGTAIQIAIEA